MNSTKAQTLPLKNISKLNPNIDLSEKDLDDILETLESLNGHGTSYETQKGFHTANFPRKTRQGYQHNRLQQNKAINTQKEENQRNRDCRYGYDCKKKFSGCTFKHPEEKEIKDCRYGYDCKKKFSGCTFKHTEKKESRDCRYGGDCRKQLSGCPFKHPEKKETRDCRYGGGCRKQFSGCPFKHPLTREEEPIQPSADNKDPRNYTNSIPRPVFHDEERKTPEPKPKVVLEKDSTQPCYSDKIPAIESEPTAQITDIIDSQTTHEEEIADPFFDTKKIYFIVNCPVYSEKGRTKIEEEIMGMFKRIKEEGLRREHHKLLEKSIYIRAVFGLNRKVSDDNSFKYDKTKIESEKNIGIEEFTWTREKPKGRKSTKPDDKNAKIPMREIRQRILDSQKTQRFFSDIDDSPHNIVYFMCIDSDTHDFNLVFSSYTDHIKHCLRLGKRLPAAMTTGYEFPMDLKTPRCFKAWFASRIDRIVRIATTQVIPNGTYFPEPNLCIRVDRQDSSKKFFLQEEFCEKYSMKNTLFYKWSQDDCDKESPFILKQVWARKNGNEFAFLDRPPLITKTPKNVEEEEESAAIKGIRQNHWHPRNWSYGLLCNNQKKYNGKTEFGEIRGSLQSFFTTLDAERINTDLNWDKRNFEDFEFYSENRYEGLPALDKVIEAAKFAQISALLWILAFFFPFKNMEDIFKENERIVFLGIYLKVAFNDDQMIEKYTKFGESPGELMKKIQAGSEAIKDSKSLNMIHRDRFSAIIKEILKAKSPEKRIESRKENQKKTLSKPGKLEEKLQEVYDRMLFSQKFPSTGKK